MKLLPLLGLVLSVFVADLSALSAEPINLRVQAIPLHTEDRAAVTVGKLRYRGGLQLSADPPFGGLSALGVSQDGARLIALADNGRRFAAHLVYAENGDLAGLRRTHLDTLAGLDGQPLTAKSEADAESMSPGVEGEIIVAFERRHRLWRYMPGQVLPEPLPPPDDLAGLPANGGLEAVTLLHDGRLLAISEGGKKKPALGWVSSTQGWSVLTYKTKGRFSVTGAATMANGDVLVLERRFTLRDGIAARLRRLPAAKITAGARLKPKLVAEFRPPLNVDNFEGIDTRQTRDGRTLVYIVSDDNFSPLQRTLLMMFELTE